MIPKTNLFKGDRVRLSRSYVNHRPNIANRSISRIGTIVNDTLCSRQHSIKVHWDGNAKAGRYDDYAPQDLVLFEEEDVFA
jgi:hypothetical protein